MAMLRDDDDPARRIAKLERIVEALVQRLERAEDARGPAYALSQAQTLLEREIVARNDDLERALADLEAINAELALAHRAAEEANRAKSRFLRAASHDLLQPLSAARIFLSHLGNAPDDARQTDIVSHLNGCIDSAEELIHALSQIARLDGQKLRMEKAPVSLRRLFWRLGADLSPLAAQRGIALRFVATDLTVQSDPVLLRQVAQNLIANALKYTTGQKVLVGMRRAGDMAWLEVIDQGPGIAPEDIRRIFMEFERLNHAGQPGHGLGLSIVERICQRMDHPLDLISVPGRGSRFRVGLPIRTDICALSPVSAAPTPPMADFSGRRVLVIDNDPAMRRAFGLLLSDWGLRVTAVSCATAACAAGQRLRPDLILTDYHLDGGETGVHAIEAVRTALGLQLPALIVSGDHSGTIASAARAMGVALLAKPVNEPALHDALRTCLRVTA